MPDRTPKWTDEHLVIAYELGYEMRGRGEDALASIDDAVFARIAPPKLTGAERVAGRMAAMEAKLPPGRGWYPGGEVDWNTGRVLDPDSPVVDLHIWNARALERAADRR